MNKHTEKRLVTCKIVKAQKNYICSACGEIIKAKSHYEYFAVDMGDHYRATKTCINCSEKGRSEESFCGRQTCGDCRFHDEANPSFDDYCCLEPKLESRLPRRPACRHFEPKGG